MQVGEMFWSDSSDYDLPAGTVWWGCRPDGGEAVVAVKVSDTQALWKVTATLQTV